MSRSSYSYDDEDDYDIRYQKRGPSPGIRYVANPKRTQNYYDAPPGPSYIGVDRLNITTMHRSRSRSRTGELSRTRERRASSPPAPVPVIINNKIYNDLSSSDEDTRHKQVARSSRRRRSRSLSSRSRSSFYMT
ncbi:reticulocyte-binding protein 2 like protein a [Fusarium bulbicola]|nr:reticulocyte-binding protein 2 like protein a [Fusarium bulbicola]